MSGTSDRAGGDAVRDLLSVADLLEEPRLARLYATLARSPGSTVRDLVDELDLAQGTAYSDVDRLVESGVVEVVDDEQPRRYAARDIKLQVTTADGERPYTVTPALVDAVGRRAVDDDVDAYIDRHGVAGLASALSYALDRERGVVTHRQMADDLDTSPLAAEMILQALRPVVHEHHDVETSGASLDEVVGDDRSTNAGHTPGGDTTDDA